MDKENKYVKKIKCELFNDNFQNYKKYHIPKKAQLVISDIPYNLGKTRLQVVQNGMWMATIKKVRARKQIQIFSRLI